MANKGSLVGAINNSNSGGNNSNGPLTMAQARKNYEAQQQQKRLEQEKRAKEELAAYEQQLTLKGIKKNTAEYKKLLEKLQKDQLKQREKDNLEILAEYYEMADKYEKDLAAAKKKLNDSIMHSSASSYSEKLKASFSNAFSGDNLGKALGNALSNTLNSFLNGLSQVMDKYVGYQGIVNTRLQGSGRNFRSAETLLTTAVGIQPYLKNEAMVENLANLVDSGIAYNVELRAFIETAKDNIATTFDAANSSLLRIVRLQQEDSTAARLGLEAQLTRYFNGMYQNTEYLSNAFDGVSDALVEASSTMDRNQSIQFEYQVQKWLGSLYSVGMSDQTVQGLAQALGYLGSGNVSALGNSQYQNLLVMAASRAGLNYGDLLTGGLTGGTTNSLLAAMASYLKEIAQGTNQVVKSELAQTFGVGISDLTAALNLNTSEIQSISGKYMNYGSAIGELQYQLSVMPTRMSIGTMMDNMWSNLLWSTGTNIAQNPMLYAMYKVTDMIQGATGGMGINIPTIGAFGNFVDLNTTVENLVKLGIVGASSLGLIGDLVSGISSTAAPLTMFTKLGIGSALQNVIGLGGRGLATATSGLTTSSTVYVGQSSGSDIAKQATQSGKDEANAVASQQEPTINYEELIRDDVSSILTLLRNTLENPTYVLRVSGDIGG